ncbi:hypothetical protein Q7P35_007827 [Cladosporium inversicolor]
MLPEKHLLQTTMAEIGSQVTQKLTDLVTGHTGSSPSSQRPRARFSHVSIHIIVNKLFHRCPGRQPDASPSTPTDGLDHGATSTSTSTAPPSIFEFSDSEEYQALAAKGDSLTDHEAEEKKAIEDMYELRHITARQDRRRIIHNMPIERVKLAWLYRNPDDLWDTDEEKKDVTRTCIDVDVERSEWENVHGIHGLSEDYPEVHEMIRERAAVAGWFVALQETVFREEWFAEGGMFGEKGSGGPPPEEVGPMGETLWSCFNSANATSCSWYT